MSRVQRKFEKQRRKIWITRADRIRKRKLYFMCAMFVVRAGIEIYDELVIRPRRARERAARS